MPASRSPSTEEVGRSADVCILIATFDRYLPLARLTRKKIEEFWRDHPPLFLCGTASETGAGVLPLRSDPSEWMSVVHDAVRDLREAGFGKCYLILDDHCPLGPCHDLHLNRTLPELMERAGAVHIHLGGWDRPGRVKGRVLGADMGFMMRIRPKVRWRFSLHPALWRLDVLDQMLERLLPETLPDLRTPWQWERRTGQRHNGFPAPWNRGCFRICCRRMSARRQGAVERFFAGVRLSVLQAIFNWGSKRSRPRWLKRFLLSHVIKIRNVYFEGPYPDVWSGIMIRGRFNRSVEGQLRRRGADALMREIADAVRQIEGASPG